MTVYNQKEARKRLESYRRQAIHYLENASEELGREEWEKGAEFLWGALAEALKAFAFYHDRLLKNHADIRRFAMEVSSELGDPEISNAFVRAERLHSDFYESFLDPEDIAEGFEYIHRVVGKLLGSIERANQTR